MPDGSTFLVFAAATLLFLVVPGPSVIYIVTRSLEQGQRGGLVSLAGLRPARSSTLPPPRSESRRCSRPRLPRSA